MKDGRPRERINEDGVEWSGASTKAVSILILLMFLAAGCLGGAGGRSGGTEPVAPSPELDETTGAIKGLVLDEENVPIAGAMVALNPAAGNATTDDGGAFTLSRVAPGTYTLFAQRLGFEAYGKKVDVAAGHVVEVTIILTALPTEEAHMQLDQYTGHLEWGVRIVPVVGGYADGDIIHLFKTDDRTDAIASYFVEMTWRDTQALAGGMRLRVEVEDEANVLRHTFCIIDSRPPGRCDGTDNVTKVLEENHSLCDEEECKMQWRGFTSTRNTGQAVDFGVMLDQHFTVYVSLFYREPMTEGYSAMPDS